MNINSDGRAVQEKINSFNNSYPARVIPLIEKYAKFGRIFDEEEFETLTEDDLAKRINSQLDLIIHKQIADSLKESKTNMQCRYENLEDGFVDMYEELDTYSGFPVLVLGECKVSIERGFKEVTVKAERLVSVSWQCL